MQRYRHWLMLSLLLVLCAATAYFGPGLWALARDEQALEGFIAGLGWFGPLVLVAVNVAQILVAPVPGYLVQAAAGYLYGTWWGGIWGSIGLLLGAMAAMGLARYFGRPLVLRLTGEERLQRWEQHTHSTNTAIWFFILLAPSGDIPYFMAGLAQVSFMKIFLLTLLIRVPTVFVVASAGAGAWLLSGWQVVAIVLVLGLLLGLFLRYQHRITALMDRQVQRRLQSEESYE